MLPHLEMFVQTLTAAVIVGCFYGLICAALSLIFGVMRIINFAQGEFLAVGMYFGFFLTPLIAGLFGLSSFPAALAAAGLAIPAFYLVGRLFHVIFLSRVSGSAVAIPTAADHQAQLVITLGVSLILQNLGMMLFGTKPRSINTNLSSDAWTLGNDSFLIFINKGQGIIALAAIAAMLLLHYFMNLSDVGRRMRASANNATAATYVGLPVQRYYGIAFGLSFGMTAMMGTLLATYYPFQPFTGFDFIIVMYAGVVLGGMGSWTGAFWGGLAIGVIQQMATLILPVQIQNTLVFVTFLAILVIRPEGIFGKNIARV